MYQEGMVMPGPDPDNYPPIDPEEPVPDDPFERCPPRQGLQVDRSAAREGEEDRVLVSGHRVTVQGPAALKSGDVRRCRQSVGKSVEARRSRPAKLPRRTPTSPAGTSVEAVAETAFRPGEVPKWLKGTVC